MQRRKGYQGSRARGGSRNPEPMPKNSPKKFAKCEKMGTAKLRMHSDQENARSHEDEKYIGPTPNDPKLILVRIVLAPSDVMLSGLDRPETLHHIRGTHKVYIDREANALDLRCESIFRLQRAVQAVNWAIRDMRMSNEHSSPRFVFQPVTHASPEDLVMFKAKARPHVLTSRSENITINEVPMTGHFNLLAAEMKNAAESLMALDKMMKMRVSFGHLIIERRKKGTQDTLTQEKFASTLEAYSDHGGAKIETKFEGLDEVQRLIRYLHHEITSTDRDVEPILPTSEVIIKAEGQVSTMEVTSMKGLAKVSTAQSIRKEDWPRLNWVVAAPDMAVDWNLRIDAWEDAETPSYLQNLKNRFDINLEKTEDPKHTLSLPRLKRARLDKQATEFDVVSLRTSIGFPYLDQELHYTIEVSIVQTWERANVAEDPEISWEVELFATHWDENINKCARIKSRKDWGEELRSIWKGDERSFEARFAKFLRTVLQVQALLGRALSETVES